MFPPLSMVVDHRGIYYDATRASDLETMLQSETDLIKGNAERIALAKSRMLAAKVSKYNDFSEYSPHMCTASNFVLVVDQTRGDMSVTLGGGDDTTFHAMLQAAICENPDSMIVVKTHPEVTQGRKRGYLSELENHDRVFVLRDKICPQTLLRLAARVYVVTSQLGFEALLAGKAVTCFGMPWYAGWGVTDDRQSCDRRVRQRSVDELFAAAYFHYSRYLDPVTHGVGTVFNVIDWLELQQNMARQATGRTIAVGYRRWKARNVAPLLGLDRSRLHFARDAESAARFGLRKEDRLIVWGNEPSIALTALARSSGAALVRMEDGFTRSVGLGSDFVPAQSLVLDRKGLYFDPRIPSDLEDLLNRRVFSDEDRKRAASVREYIVEHAITKYNIEPRHPPEWRTDGRRVVLVPGQVEDDASIRFGCDGVRTNLQLLEAARAHCPSSYIVYKPHPDVLAKNRKGNVDWKEVRRFADVVEIGRSVISCIEAADELHTMTSLSGFDALLRGKAVVVHGRPFYAGWGLTNDRLTIARRERRLSLDELVAGVLLHYPIYWDWTLKGFTTCEAVLRHIVRERDAVERYGHETRPKFDQSRPWRKLGMWLRADFRIQNK